MHCIRQGLLDFGEPRFRKLHVLCIVRTTEPCETNENVAQRVETIHSPVPQEEPTNGKFSISFLYLGLEILTMPFGQMTVTYQFKLAKVSVY